MSIIDKAIAAITPPESDDDRASARQTARNLAEPGDWLSTVLDHHLQIEAALDDVRDAEPEMRPAAFKKLATILNGHSLAEEVVLYPAVERGGEKGAAAMAYQEQSLTKVQMARLELIDPASQDYLDKLEHIRGALLHHMYEEEGTWLSRLKQSALKDDQMLLTARFAEEYDRYVGDGSYMRSSTGAAEQRAEATALLSRDRDNDMARDPRDGHNMGSTVLT